MPYIESEGRPLIGDHARRLGNHVFNPGELNNAITTTIVAYLGSGPHYRDFNEVIGVLECVKQELYRRMIAPYEDQAMARNGDVFP